MEFFNFSNDFLTRLVVERVLHVIFNRKLSQVFSKPGKIGIECEFFAGILYFDSAIVNFAYIYHERHGIRYIDRGGNAGDVFSGQRKTKRTRRQSRKTLRRLLHRLIDPPALHDVQNR